MSLIDITNITADNLHTLCSEGLTDLFFTTSMNENELSENFSIIMDKAREYSKENEVFSHYQQQAQFWNIPELWEKPKPFGNCILSVPFQMNSLPDVLKGYITEIYVAYRYITKCVYFLHCRFKTVEELEQPLETLLYMGYIREINTECTGRKQSSEYKINPLIY